MTYEHPLAYLLGLEGIALLRAFTGEHDRGFVDARLAEIRRLLDDPALAHAGVQVEHVDTVEGYRLWARSYDDPANAAFALDQPVVENIISALPAGTALDAACGTGRYARRLAELGHHVIGVDSSPDMLALARKHLPHTDFRHGDLHRLPVDDAGTDLVVCALALTHVADLTTVLAEFARVLRPGGSVVIADVHPEAVARGSIPALRTCGGQPARLVTHRHLVGDYLRAALPTGLQPRRCEEPRFTNTSRSRPDEPGTLDPWELWPWSLTDLVPEAAEAANAGVPAMLIWHFQLPAR
ncbi:class I SAM-dependent methyltransferase [Saccharopolyspora erythraea]|uniref:class I SAM-dependent methyltransferase n=1 Tax=Saccharopolyspora erythraea TaxID=1836 RepID=UPI001BA9FA45|nr:class I SAM-dependent methyltransferase [Saccharopolyspora erythraea]QUH02923.1 class I SAM-dependent methyltransferase [Saccharopolyspora erythraea]